MIEIKNLNKVFDSLSVLENVNVIIPDDTITGVIGINGAGKSTLLKLISGIYTDYSGEILIDGNKLDKAHNYNKEVFMLPDDPYYNYSFKCIDLKKLYRIFYHSFDDNTFDEYKAKLEIPNDQTIISMSKGQRRRLFIALALASNAKYILIDEAFDGLDPLARAEFKELIINYLEKNKRTIIISSHSLNDLSDLADSFIMIENKHVSSSGGINAELDKYVKYQLVYKDKINRNIFDELKPLDVYISGRIVRIVVTRDKDCLEALRNTKPLLIEELNMDFEEYFINMARRSNHD